jgi:DNA-binding transcriptional ArsR family regulator
MTLKRAARRYDPFKALADPTRRAILELLSGRGTCSAGEVADAFPQISRPAVSRHLRVLRHSGLVSAQGIGREQRYDLDIAELARVQHEWFFKFTPIRNASLAALKKQVEGSGADLQSRDLKRSGRYGAKKGV